MDLETSNKLTDKFKQVLDILEDLEDHHQHMVIARVLCTMHIALSGPKEKLLGYINEVFDALKKHMEEAFHE